MPWGRLDDSLYDHPKLDLIPADERLAAVGLWARAISWCNRFLTDGLVPRDRILKLDGTLDLADRLVAAGLFEASDVPSGHYLIHDFLEFNDSREAVIERRQKEAERKAAYRASRKRPGGTDNGTDATDTHDVPPGQPKVSRDVSRRVSPRDSRTRESRPDPTRPIDSPHPPASGGRPSRANGTSPRQVAKADAAATEAGAAARRWRVSQRQHAYLRGAVTADQERDMNRRDAPLDEIPDWTTHLAKLAAEAADEAWS